MYNTGVRKREETTRKT